MMQIEPHFPLRRNRDAIKHWVRRLSESNPSPENPEAEAASWYRELSGDRRSRLEAEMNRLWCEEDDLIGLDEGPLGELVSRFSRLITLESRFVAPVEPRGPRLDCPGESEENDLAVELRRLEDVDPAWFDAWRKFADALDEPQD